MSTTGIIVGIICMIIGWAVSFYWGATYGVKLGFEEGMRANVIIKTIKQLGESSEADK